MVGLLHCGISLETIAREALRVDYLQQSNGKGLGKLHIDN